MNPDSVKTWTADDLLALARAYQGAAILAAAADLDLFDALTASPQPRSVSDLARDLQCGRRGLTILLDALAALEVVLKEGDQYAPAPGTADCLTASGRQSILAMAQHQANCLRRWTQLARVVKTGAPADRTPSVRGETRDGEAFIGAMDNVSAPVAEEVIQAVQPRTFRHVLDVGGASGTWTIAFLRACPTATATLFDLPEVIPLARQRLQAVGLLDRVQLHAGDFMADALPAGPDLAWVSAIVHQNSRPQNRALFENVFQALLPGGRIAIRDILMEAHRTKPVSGALFAVNMLVATEGGGTFTFQELQEDLAAAGFVDAQIARRDDAMNSVITAGKPV